MYRCSAPLTNLQFNFYKYFQCSAPLHIKRQSRATFEENNNNIVIKGAKHRNINLVNAYNIIPQKKQ
jgi:hypothetical protein